ncbi:MAG: TauD/TfdA family dioxygenase [Acidimicrobiales bacterium]|nr:TauD/TfdA family dioxygenase [Acidimicrobiales bacterium]
MVIRWADGVTLRAYALWLWENRMADQGIDERTREGKLDPADLPDPSELAEPRLVGGHLLVDWASAPTSEFDSGWLRHVADGRHETSATIPVAELWSATALPEPPSRPGSPVLDGDDAALHEFLELLCRFGIVRLRGLPISDDVVPSIGGRIGALRDTNFGVTWPVSVDIAPTSTANTPLPLPPHTDLPTRETPPGHQILHCKVNTCVGGLCTMADGYAVAAHIEQHYPVDYEALTSLRWTFFNRSPEHDHRWSGPVIDRGAAGEPLTLRAFHPLRAFPDMPDGDVPRAYTAVKRFSEVAGSDEFQMRYWFEPGDLVAFDNRRILHGRSPIDAEGGTRVLHGTYIDHDEIYSRLRVLTRRLEATNPAFNESEAQQ